MHSQKERTKIARKIWKELIPLCCNGNKDAEDYLKRFFFIIRIIDDLNDGDHPVENSDIIRGFFLLMADIPGNKFFKEHADMLTGVQLIGFNAWQDANIWDRSKNETKKLYAHVLRDYICELFILVAYITGGNDLMRNASMKVRAVFLKKP